MRTYCPLTPQLAARAELLSRVHPRAVVAEIVGVSYPTLTRAKRRGWKASSVGHPARPRPTDFAIMVGRGLSNVALMAHYQAGIRAVRRWRREIGA